MRSYPYHPVGRTVEQAVQDLLDQQKLDDSPGFEVRVSNSQQVFLNTRRPTRVPISHEMLRGLVPELKTNRHRFLMLKNTDNGEASYHLYLGGDTWVPTIPPAVARHEDVFHAEISELTPDTFLERFPTLMFTNQYLTRGMPDEVLVKVTREDKGFRIEAEQWPTFNGVNDWSLHCLVDGGLVHQTGSTILPFYIEDVFSIRRKFRLYHDGCKRVKLAVLFEGSCLRVLQLSSDGFRARFVYEMSHKERASTSIYLRQPSVLYKLGDLVEVPNRFRFHGVRRLFELDSVEVLNPHEMAMVEQRRSYPAGRVGAEIAYTVISEKFGHRNLVIEEPGRGGKDLYSTDFRVAVEARLARPARYTIDWQVEKEIEQMSWKLQKDFRYTPKAEIGYAVLSVYRNREINSIIAEVEPRRKIGGP